MKQKAVVVPAPVSGWWFRDRQGYLFGPYVDLVEIRNILHHNRVGQTFISDTEGRPCFDYVMENEDGLRVNPEEWVTEQIKLRRNQLRKTRTYPRYIYREGPVEGVHHHGCCSRYRNSKFGHKLRELVHGCVEDGEPPIRTKLQVDAKDLWGDYPFRRAERSWKSHRRHQWHS